MRIYYANRGLRGGPYFSESINPDVFAALRNRDEKRIPDQASLSAVGGFPEIDFDTGEYTDYDYASDEGLFYIPPSICLSEPVAPGLKDLYYVVLCGGEVELRYLRRDFGQPWFQTVGRDEAVTSRELIARMERTMALLAETNRDREPEPIAAAAVSKKVLLSFLELLGARNPRRLASQVHDAAASPLKFYADHAARLKRELGFNRAYAGWHLTMLRLALERQRRVMRVDWKEAGEEVRAKLLDLLPEGAESLLADYRGSEAYGPQVLRECGGILETRYGLTVLLWDTGGDEYAFLTVPCAAAAEAVALARQLGLALRRVEERPE